METRCCCTHHYSARTFTAIARCRSNATLIAPRPSARPLRHILSNSLGLPQTGGSSSGSIAGESAAPEFRHCQHCALVEVLAGDFHTTPDVLAIHEGDLAGAGRGHEDIVAPWRRKGEKYFGLWSHRESRRKLSSFSFRRSPVLLLYFLIQKTHAETRTAHHNRRAA